MAEYIEREALKSQIAENKLMVREPAAKRILAMIDDIPTADVAPVVHGRWLTWEEQFPGLEPRRKNNLGVYCSSCHTRSDCISPYCPICGAKMDEEETHDR